MHVCVCFKFLKMGFFNCFSNKMPLKQSTNSELKCTFQVVSIQIVTCNFIFFFKWIIIIIVAIIKHERILDIDTDIWCMFQGKLYVRVYIYHMKSYQKYLGAQCAFLNWTCINDEQWIIKSYECSKWVQLIELRTSTSFAFNGRV